MSNSNSNNNNPITNNNLFSGKVEKFQFEHKNNSAKVKKERKKARKTLKKERRLNKERRVRDNIDLPIFLRSGKRGISRFLNSRNVSSLASTSKAMRGVAPYNTRLPPANRPITIAGRERRTQKSIPIPKRVRSGITSYLKPSNLQSLEATGKTFRNTVSHNTLHNRKRAARARQPVTMTELAARGNAEAKKEFREFHLYDDIYNDSMGEFWDKGYSEPPDVSLGDYISNGEWKNGLYSRLKKAEGDNHMMSRNFDEGRLFLRGYRPVKGRKRREGNTSLQSAVSNAEESLHTNPNLYHRPLLRQSGIREDLLSNRSLHKSRMEHPLASIKRFRMPNASGNGEGSGETKSTRRRKNNNKKNKNKKNNNKKTKNRNKNGGRKTRKHKKK